ncbi:MAG: hypothetical protein QOC63_3688, partial [Mycobacterium sp.]|nr:hypothetical protein [Mycobacterium sp.]
MRAHRREPTACSARLRPPKPPPTKLALPIPDILECLTDLQRVDLHPDRLVGLP